MTEPQASETGWAHIAALVWDLTEPLLRGDYSELRDKAVGFPAVVAPLLAVSHTLQPPPTRWEGLKLLPNLYEAVQVLATLSNEGSFSERVLKVTIARAWAKGYQIPDEQPYDCTACKATGRKLWRPVHDTENRYCADCALAGTDIELSPEGTYQHEYGRTDQIRSKSFGSLLPCIPAADGGIYGYTSASDGGCLWWRTLPLRS